MTNNSIAKQLRAHGHKLTPQRLAVLKVISGSHDHLTPAEIHARVKTEFPSVSLVTVYRMLDVLNDLQLICRVHAQGDCHTYLLRRPEGHHHHLVCSGCGTVVDFTGCDVTNLVKRLSKKTGFTIQGHLLEFQGICADCACKTGLK